MMVLTLMDLGTSEVDFLFALAMSICFLGSAALYSNKNLTKGIWIGFLIVPLAFLTSEALQLMNRTDLTRNEFTGGILINSALILPGLFGFLMKSLR